ncbi:MAG: hypothetical protein K1X39_06855, partial [Thermoflexales bacterium]|nr:hypothetical protein [Thermoflexales bacterium]
ARVAAHGGREDDDAVQSRRGEGDRHNAAPIVPQDGSESSVAAFGNSDLDIADDKWMVNATAPGLA